MEYQIKNDSKDKNKINNKLQVASVHASFKVNYLELSLPLISLASPSQLD